MTQRTKTTAIIALLLVAAASYWWYFLAARHDLQMEIIGIQGDVTVNGNKLTDEIDSFNADHAVIQVAENGIFNGKLEDGSFIQLTQNSQLTIAQAKRNNNSFKVRTKFVLDTGQIIRDIPKTEAIGDYSSSLITTSVDIGIRGTRYAAIADDQQTRTMLYQGSVSLSSTSNDEIILKQNFGTVTERGKASQPPSELPPPPGSLDNIQADRIITREFDLGWQTVSQANAYLVEIAEDEAFRNLVFRMQVTDNRLTIAGLPYDANFSWRVSTIDNRGLRGQPSRPARFHYKYHHELVKVFNGSPDEASRLFKKALKGYADDIFLIKDIGKYFYRIKQYDKALAYYNRALAIEPENDELLLERGRVFQALGKQPEAEKDFNNSLTIKTDNAEALWSLGNVESDKGKQQGAIEYYYRAIAAQPDHIKAHLSAARAWMALGRTDKAHRHLMLHLENYPQDKAATLEFEQISLDLNKTNQGRTSK
jgi:tetratricopeptide (TPR) repeat protein